MGTSSSGGSALGTMFTEDRRTNQLLPHCRNKTLEGICEACEGPESSTKKEVGSRSLEPCVWMFVKQSSILWHFCTHRGCGSCSRGTARTIPAVLSGVGVVLAFGCRVVEWLECDSSMVGVDRVTILFPVGRHICDRHTIASHLCTSMGGGADDVLVGWGLRVGSPSLSISSYAFPDVAGLCTFGHIGKRGCEFEYC